MKKLLLLLPLLATPALADDVVHVPLSDKVDVPSIRQLCDIARASPAISLELSNSASGYCLGLLNKIKLIQESKEREDAKQKSSNGPPDGNGGSQPGSSQANGGPGSSSKGVQPSGQKDGDSTKKEEVK